MRVSSLELVAFALRQAFTLEGIGLAVVSAVPPLLTLHLLEDVADRVLTGLGDTPQQHLVLLQTLLSFLLLPLVAALYSRLNRRLFDRPLPDGLLTATAMLIKAPLMGGLMLTWAVGLPAAVAAGILKLAGLLDLTTGTILGLAAGGTAIWLITDHGFYFLETLYRHRAPLARVRRMTRGNRLRLFGAILLVTLAWSLVVFAFGLLCLAAEAPRATCLQIGQAIFGLVQAPLFAVSSRIYFEAEAALALPVPDASWL
ncbi:hypothetical protein [Zavarzinia sp.]|uniref:hypothetical protein n=1 Tax=Zavarzinia sp. TaxID=2027920 RepID=UPI0035635E65